MADVIIKAENLTKVYTMGAEKVYALKGVSLDIFRGTYVSIMGPSGSGKSTLMNILGCLDKPTSGTYLLNGENVEKLNDDQLADIRNRQIGFVFQSYNLLPRTTTVKNVMLPMAYAGIEPEEREARAIKYLKLVGLGDRLKHTSNQLSGGQQQRVAIARALSMHPSIILADEPTGNIASAQAEEIMNIFQKINQEGNTIIMITHEPDIAEHAKRIIVIRDGKIVTDSTNHKQKIIKDQKQ